MDIPATATSWLKGKDTSQPCNNLGTFSHERVLPRASQCAVDLAYQLHVVQEGVEGIEVREADHVRGAAACSLAEERQRISSTKSTIKKLVSLY